MSREQDLLDGRVDPPLRRVRWRAAVRIIASRYPPIDLFERVAESEDFEALYEIEALTNPRIRDRIGEIRLVPPGERVYGPGSSFIMAPFTHLNPEGGRFNDATFGAFYAAQERAAAVAETCHHKARFLARTREPPLQLEMRVLEARLDARLHDLRGQQRALPRIYDPDGYVFSQRLARRLRGERSWGIAFDSVRRAGGQCAAAFRPRALADCRQAEHLVFVWDGARIAEIFERRPYCP